MADKMTTNNSSVCQNRTIDHEQNKATISNPVATGGYNNYLQFSEQSADKTNNHQSKRDSNGLLVDKTYNGFSHRNDTSQSSNRRFHPYGTSSNDSHDISKTASKTLQKSITGWYHIDINLFNMKNCDIFLKKLETYIKPIVFHLYNKQYSKDRLTFLVDDYDIAQQLYKTNINIMQKETGAKKIIIRVTPYYPSYKIISCTPVSNKIKEKMTEVIVTRYNANTQNLDLSKLYASPLFIENELFVPLNRPAVLLVALNIAAQITNHNLYTLNLESNQIYLGEGLVWIRRLFPELKILKLGDNKLSNLKELKCLSGFTIEVLTFSKNPVEIKEDEAQYIKYLQQIFPALKYLDNRELPFHYHSIINLKLKMPNNLGSSYPIPNIGKYVHSDPVNILVNSFLTKYYNLYDNNVSRCKVADIYHENAIFSLSSSYASNNYGKGSLDHYLSNSQNCLTPGQNNNGKIHKGKYNILNLLENLPKTKHDFDSFIIDVTIATTSMIQFVVNGVFAEVLRGTVYDGQKNFRSFCRSFNILFNGSSWFIVNDMLYITVVSNESFLESLKRFVFKPNEGISFINNNFNNKSNVPIFKRDGHNFKIPDSKQSFSNEQRANIPDSPASPDKENPYSVSKNEAPVFPLQSISTLKIASQKLDRVNKLTMIKKLSNQSGMNNQWSQKCLEENDWNYIQAILSLSNQKSSIPAEAFIH